MEERRIAIVGAGDLGPEIAQQLIDYAKEHDYEVVVVGAGDYDLIRAHRSFEDELRILDICPITPAVDMHVLVLASLQEDVEDEYIEAHRDYDVTFIGSPNSDGVTWFKQRYPRALVYSWQQAQDLNFDARRAPSRTPIGA